MHAHDDPVDITIATGGGQFLFQPGLLSAGRIAPDVRVAAVLVANVIVGDADHAHRTGREGVPKPTRHIRLASRLRHREVGLIGPIPDRSVTQLVLVVAGRGHPGTFTGAAAVVVPEIPPGPHPVLGEIGVTEIAVEQVEQGLQPLHAERGIARRRRAKIVIHIRWIRQRHPRGRHVLLAEGRCALIAEAGESERRATARREVRNVPNSGSAPSCIAA